MDPVTIFIWVIAVILFIVMISVIVFGSNSIVYIFDEHNNVYKKKARLKKDSTVSFKYNASSKGGVSIEGNKYKIGKKPCFYYRDINGILLPITDKKITESLSSLQLSTSQEKWYETKALENISFKIDNTWWNQIKPFLMGFIIVFGAVIVAIVMIQKALDVEPIPEPQLEMWKDTNTQMIKMVESNERLISTIANQQTKPNEIPR